MAWQYKQSTGEMSRNGVVAGVGYSGAGEGRNNPALQAVANVGPIPQGSWRIGAPYNDPHKGPTVLPLAPVGHNALGRSGFLIHGDNTTHDASTGCIILAPTVRQQIAASGDADLTVVA